jgi:hypothetical protein
MHSFGEKNFPPTSNSGVQETEKPLLVVIPAEGVGWGVREVCCSEDSQAVPARPSGKYKLIAI